MPFEKGNKLAVGGRKEKPWRDALNVALKDKENGKALRMIADKCVEAALEGDKDARREIAERLDGKVPQAVIGDNDEDPISVTQTDSRDLARAVLDLLRCAEIEGGEENGQDSIET